jgi:hypothetical protein
LNWEEFASSFRYQYHFLEMDDCRPVYINAPCENESWDLPGDSNVLIEQASANSRPASVPVNSTYGQNGSDNVEYC